ncbi:hypothetical protein ACIRFH_02480 [Streptomyces sp. NPDC093586]|uniref:hypothetical protein n=1 Tax=Streptomyces sp. NPDC093586 TaxID=3366042 RepID=UPI00381FFC4A
MSMGVKECSREELAAQPIGAWSGEAYRRVVGALRAEPAVEDLTQPHWWTLDHVAGKPGKWTRLVADDGPFETGTGALGPAAPWP